ncbi:unnamed protein product [Caenorhabditis auriculariae]|uniref:G-protein coupled receptors family 1 profile domain-containing protein n=1 Tax=Caenorhabditis auriculariae TaxID=2777116 RepID=A0A8S1H5N3_9PELO|nr:unnamed protein product [Caenorhabditis auriculariae]
MALMPWQVSVFIAEVIVTVPFYASLVVLILIWRRHYPVFRSPYYTMTLAQALPDFLISATFTLIYLARYFQIGNQFLFSLQDYYFPSWVKNQSTILTIMKAFGVAVISYQRYLTLCKPHSWLNKMFKKSPPWCLLLLLWGVPVLICTPVWMDHSTRFLDPVTLAVTNPPASTQIPAVILMCSLVPTFLSVVYFYGRILQFLLSHKDLLRKDGDKRMRREIRLSLHVFILVCYFGLIFSYVVARAIFESLGREDLWATYLRANWALLQGNFAFINPWTLVVLNFDVQRHLKHSRSASAVESTSRPGVQTVAARATQTRN